MARPGLKYLYDYDRKIALGEPLKHFSRVRGNETLLFTVVEIGVCGTCA